MNVLPYMSLGLLIYILYDIGTIYYKGRDDGITNNVTLFSNKINVNHMNMNMNMNDLSMDQNIFIKKKNSNEFNDTKHIKKIIK